MPTEIHSAGSGHEAEAFDAEIKVRPIVLTMVWTLAAAVASVLLVLGMFRVFEMMESRSHKAMMPIEAMNRQPPPPAPWLEGIRAKPDGTRADFPESPYVAFDHLRDEENRLIEHAGWVDKEQGVVRLPIDVALDVVAAKGLEAPAAAASPVAASPVAAPAAAGAVH